MKRFTAAFRGGDRGEKPWEWCIIDEDEGWYGSAIIFDLTEEDAKLLALNMNAEYEYDRTSPPRMSL